MRKCSVEGCCTILNEYNTTNKCLRHYDKIPKDQHIKPRWIIYDKLDGIYISEKNYNGSINKDDY